MSGIFGLVILWTLVSIPVSLVAGRLLAQISRFYSEPFDAGSYDV